MAIIPKSLRAQIVEAIRREADRRNARINSLKGSDSTHEIGIVNGLRMAARIAEELPERRTYTCPRCGSVTADPLDVEASYCRNCGRHHGTDEV